MRRQGLIITLRQSLGAAIRDCNTGARAPSACTGLTGSRRSLQARFSDRSLRVVYPVHTWSVEGSMNPGIVIVTLRTPDGFAVSFGLSRDQLLDMWTQSAAAETQ
jgi:hypothetical protein